MRSVRRVGFALFICWTTIFGCAQTRACNQIVNQMEFELLAAGFSTLFGVEEVTVEQLLDWQKNADAPLLLIDVRRPEEQSVSHLPGAVLASTDEDLSLRPEVQNFRARFQNDARHNARIIVYCAAGYRSGQSIAVMSGDTTSPPVRNLRGGIIAYANAGGALVTPNGDATRRVHGYSEKWSSYLRAPAQPVLEPAIPDA